MGTSVQYTGRQDLSGGWCLREDALNGSRQRAPVARGPDAPKPELGEAIFAEVWAAGQALSLDEAVALALRQADESEAADSEA